jgi:antitoxin component YwqK of YwqJK toxin-antitoxin module
MSEIIGLGLKDNYQIMKNIIYIVCLGLLLVSSVDAREVSYLQDRNGVMYEPNQETPYTGKYVSYWDDDQGQKSEESNLKDGKYVGLTTSWYQNGQKETEGKFKDGEQDGLWTIWYENGQKNGEGYYKEGELDGLWTSWDENGNITKTETYSNGELVKQ